MQRCSLMTASSSRGEGAGGLVFEFTPNMDTVILRKITPANAFSRGLGRYKSGGAGATTLKCFLPFSHPFVGFISFAGVFFRLFKQDLCPLGESGQQ